MVEKGVQIEIKVIFNAFKPASIQICTIVCIILLDYSQSISKDSSGQRFQSRLELQDQTFFGEAQREGQP